MEFVCTKGLDKKFKLSMMYDGTGRRISKTRWVKARGDAGTLGVETSPEQCSDK